MRRREAARPHPYCVPGVSLRTTFIVGFPGETEADVASSEDFVKTVRFDHVGVFTYLHEEGTSAHQLADDVGAGTKTPRRNRLMKVQKRLVGDAQKARIGTAVRLVVDGPAAEHELRTGGRGWRARRRILTRWSTSPSAIQRNSRPDSSTGAKVVGSRDYDLLARPLGST